MYVRSLTYEPVVGGQFAGVVMFHIELAREGQFFFEPVDLYKKIMELAKMFSRVNNSVFFTVPDQLEGQQVEELMQLFGTLRDNGVFVIAETVAYYRPAWIGNVDYLIVNSGNESPLPFACNEFWYIPEEGTDLSENSNIRGYQKADHYLYLIHKFPANDVFKFLSVTLFKVITPNLFKYKISFIDEEKSNVEESKEDDSNSYNSSPVIFDNDVIESIQRQRSRKGQG